MSAAPAVSLIVVSRDRPAFLKRLLLALRYQTLDAFEVIVVSNTPVTPQPGLRFEPYDEANIAQARNIGLGCARAPVIAFCDDDAIPDPAWLERLAAPFADPSVGYAGGNTRGPDGVRLQHGAYHADRSGTVRAVTATADPWQKFEPDNTEFFTVTGVNSAFRARAVDAVGGFDPAYRYFLDETDLCLRLAQAGWAGAHVLGAQVQHFSAPSANRNTEGVPDFYRLGVSKAYFCTRHLAGDAAAALDAFAAAQAEGLRKRRVGPAEIARHIAALRAGFRDGATPAPEPLAHVSAPPLEQCFASQRRRHILVAGRARDEAHLFAQAADLARTSMVTVLLAEPGLARLSCTFVDIGFWVHRGGLWGKLDAGAAALVPRSLTGFARSEAARLKPFRPVDEVLVVHAKKAAPITLEVL